METDPVTDVCLWEESNTVYKSSLTSPISEGH